MAEPYDLRSNIKGKPGSQGTLFQVKDKALLNPSQRWPRGYTPERQAEVSHALKDIPITADPETRGVEEQDYDERNRVEAIARPRVTQAIARSTIPVKHLEDLSEIHDQLGDNTSGTYWPRTRKIAIDLSGVDEEDSRESEKSLIHEIGHHFDEAHSMNRERMTPEVAKKHAWQDMGKYQDKPTGSGLAMAHNKVQAGVAEASADNYYVEHFRPHGRNTHTDPAAYGRYEENFTPAQRERDYPGYNDVRPPKPDHLGPQFQEEKLF